MRIISIHGLFNCFFENVKIRFLISKLGFLFQKLGILKTVFKERDIRSFIFFEWRLVMKTVGYGPRVYAHFQKKTKKTVKKDRTRPLRIHSIGIRNLIGFAKPSY